MKTPVSSLLIADSILVIVLVVTALLGQSALDLVVAGETGAPAKDELVTGEARLVRATTEPPRMAQAEFRPTPPELSEDEQNRLEEALKRTNLPGPRISERHPLEQPLNPVQVPPTNPPGGTSIGVLAGPSPAFTRTTNLRSALPTSLTSTIGEPSAANNGDYVLQTGNWYAALSSNGGQSFNFVNPFTTFPASHGGFCCDQEVLYDPSRDTMFWLLMYAYDASYSNTLRLAIAKGQGNLASGSWYYYDFRPQELGYDSGYWYDYPHIALSNNYLYLTANVFYGRDNWASSVFLRISLDDLAAGVPSSALSYDAYIATSHFNFGLVQGATTTIYFASNSGSSLRIYRLSETSNTVYYSDVSITPDPSGTPTAPGPDSRDWAGRADTRVLGGWVANGVIGFMWNAPQGTVSSTTYPYPYVHVARFVESTMTLINEPNLWSPFAAWLYPSVTVNGFGHIAGSVFYGGGSYYPSLAVFIWDSQSSNPPPWDVYTVASGTSGPPTSGKAENRWGDYLAARPHYPDRDGWVATGYTLLGGSGTSNVQPWFLHFGRTSVATPTPTPTPTTTPTPTSTPTPTPSPTPMPYGMAVTSVRDGPGIPGVSTTLSETKGLNFGYVQVYVRWASIEPFQGAYAWAPLDEILTQTDYYGLKPVTRIYLAPSWARPPGSDPRTPPTDTAYMADFMRALVSRYGTRIAGYIVWNEPNLAFEWGGQSPSASSYMDLLMAAYNGAKSVNPAVTIVSAGLAPTGGGTGAISDLTFLQQMYAAGLKYYSDVVGMNGLGFRYSPDDNSDPNGFNFSRLVSLRNIMVTNSDGDKKAWALEVGWLRDSAVDLGSYNWMKVSDQQQAEYLKRALERIRDEWTWLELAFVWNLDFSSNHPSSSEKYWYSIRSTQAYDRLRELQTPTPTPTSTPTPTPAPPRLYLPSIFRNLSTGW